MKDVFTQIKDALIRLLKEIDPDIDVFAEEISRTDDLEQNLDAVTYYFIDLIPMVLDTVDEYFTDASILIDIAFHDRKESNAVYLIKTEQIDSKIRPVLRFGDRSVTIHNASSKVVEHVLHYTFTIRVRVCRKKVEEHDFMGELETEVREGE